MSKCTKMNAGGNTTTNSSQFSYNKYISGSGVGAQTASNLQAKRKLSIMCFPCNKNIIYAVTYNGNGENSGTPPNSALYKAGTLVTVSVNVGLLEIPGFAFVGWNTQPDGNGTTYDYSNPSFIITGNITLYAKWVQNAPLFYTLTYIVNDNDVTGIAPINELVFQPTIITISNQGSLSRPNYMFAGWEDIVNNTVYYGGEPVLLNTNINLYALWIDQL